MQTSKRNRGAFSLLISEVDYLTDRTATMYSYSPGQSLPLPGQEIAFQ
jgi:hypothetical protein